MPICCYKASFAGNVGHLAKNDKAVAVNLVNAEAAFHLIHYTRMIDNDGDMYEGLHVLAQEVGIMGIFSDWPATTTYYANCMKLK